MPLPLFSSRNDGVWPAGRGAGVIERSHDGGHIVSIHNFGGQPLRFKLAAVEVRIVPVRRPVALPQGVDVSQLRTRLSIL